MHGSAQNTDCAIFRNRKEWGDIFLGRESKHDDWRQGLVACHNSIYHVHYIGDNFMNVYGREEPHFGMEREMRCVETDYDVPHPLAPPPHWFSKENYAEEVMSIWSPFGTVEGHGVLVPLFDIKANTATAFIYTDEEGEVRSELELNISEPYHLDGVKRAYNAIHQWCADLSLHLELGSHRYKLTPHNVVQPAVMPQRPYTKGVAKSI